MFLLTKFSMWTEKSVMWFGCFSFIFFKDTWDYAVGKKNQAFFLPHKSLLALGDVFLSSLLN